ncbi:MAG: 4Fe-4S dicluster domain-containing protein [Flavobacteriales bacterium]|nr:MAG: 4Fe-4S dicluster domain-containing protein [Flavobacteriales bacterium]CAI8311858.1 MAG: Menaquinone reductase, iron-sulfur cluster-binding subunit [Flavobacteriales bacterium]|tara:strand:+ start:1394 stop:4450 length:3057 start_codon:yes stop_codon:yes gene_type:complete
MEKKNIYWKGFEELNKESEIVKSLEQNEFVEKLPVGNEGENKNHNRRDFLKYAGFSTAAAAVVGCEGPVIKSVPYVVQPEQIIPGIANYYATTIADGYDFSSILVKTKAGRPIFIKGNKDAKSMNCTNARINASVLSMYDVFRLQGPKLSGENISWKNFNSSVKADLSRLLSENKKVVLLTQSFASPTTEKIINNFIQKYSNIQHVVYDAVSNSSALDAFENSYGKRALADYDFSLSNTIISIDADFMNDWQGGNYSSGWSKNRVPNEDNNFTMSYHLQFESNMTLSGANADNRVMARPHQLKQVLQSIYFSLRNQKYNGPSLGSYLDRYVKLAVESIKKSGNKAVVISGLDDVDSQEIVLMINELINSDAFNIKSPKLIFQGSDKDILNTIKELKSGKISGLITAGINPSYTLPNSDEFSQLLNKLEFSLCFSMKEDETAQNSKYIAATPHYLESWGDYEFKSGNYYLSQPTIKPLFDTNQFQDVLLDLIDSQNSFYDEIKNNWRTNILKGKTWGKSLQDGYYYSYDNISLNRIKSNLTFSNSPSSNDDTLDLILYTKTGLGDGQQSSNPWLQEFPDPITRVTWDNYLTISYEDAERLDLKNYNVSNGALNGSYVNLSNENHSLKVPVIIQPGQTPGTVGLSLGYGKTQAMSEEMNVGVNAYRFYDDFKRVHKVKLTKAEGDHEFACIQLHNTMMGRDEIIKETSLKEFVEEDKSVWNPTVMVSKNHIETMVTSKEVDIWREFDRSTGHHFNLSIDLNKCNGCGACVIACHAENNVPVVGKEEVRKSRDMHWIRIDRYYSSQDTIRGDVKAKDETSGYREYRSTQTNLEKASANPQVVFQPVSCMHCNHAPCETVCPVAATSHGREGQNQMAYNRCVGTRYCANNCPYKVRRFNWFQYSENDEFDYNMNNPLGKMAINPDVNVRSRGVMEKCSLCIQMTQKVKLDAKKEGRRVRDGEFKTACSESCDDNAMVFGDINDKESEILRVKDGDRTYRVLESIGTKPNVIYQVKIRNSKKI